MLNLLSIVLTLLVSGSPMGEKEENYSIYFDGKSAPKTEKLASISTKLYGKYSLVPRSENDLRDVAGDLLIADETGIYLEKNKLLSISREEIRENSKYTISNGYLHGVLMEDSVMVAMQDDSYYFLIPKKSYLCEYGTPDNMLFGGQTNSSFLILTKEDNAYYSALYLTFTAGRIALMELNFEQTEFDFRSVNHKKLADETTPSYLLQPSQKEWEKLMSYFRTYDTYSISQSQE